MANKLIRTSVATAATAVLLVGVAGGSAYAGYQQTGPAVCEFQVRVASTTTGQTYHSTSAGQLWDKGIKNNMGVGTETGFNSLAWVQTDAPTIHSSGYACNIPLG